MGYGEISQLLVRALRRREGAGEKRNDSEPGHSPSDPSSATCGTEALDSRATRTAGSLKRVGSGTEAALVREVEREAGAEPGKTNL